MDEELEAAALADLVEIVENGDVSETAEEVEQVEEEVQNEENPIQEQEVQEVVENTPAEEVKQTSNVDMETLSKLMEMQETQNEKLNNIESLATQEPQAELSEEDLALKDLADKLGLTQALEENQVLKETIAKLQEAEETRVAQIQQQHEMEKQVNEAVQVLNEIKTSYNVDESELSTKIDDLIKGGVIKQEDRENPTIWKMTAMQMHQNTKPIEEPDPIISGQGGNNTTQNSAFKRKQSGENVSDTDLASELLGLGS